MCGAKIKAKMKMKTKKKSSSLAAEAHKRRAHATLKKGDCPHWRLSEC